MRALLITTLPSVDSSELRYVVDILAREDVQAVTTGTLGAGAYLANAIGSEISAAIAILPRQAGDHGGWAALMIEAGICLGMKIPLLLIVDPSERRSAASGGFVHVVDLGVACSA